MQDIGAIMLKAAKADESKNAPFPAYGDTYLFDAALLQAQIGRPFANQLPAVREICQSLR